jgi:glycerophosphoryl diester phosphodiesterase
MLIACKQAIVLTMMPPGLLLLTWGHENNNVECCRLQEACGVDAVITDHVAHVRKGLVPKQDVA